MSKKKKTSKKNLRLLYRSFDTELEEKEKQRLEEALIESENLRREKDRLLERRQSIAETAAQSFRPQFAERVMAHIVEIDEETSPLESFYEALKVAFRRFAIAGALAVLALIFFNLIKGDILPMDEIFFASDMALEEILNFPIF
jgi:nitrate/nitrite-specific signal transduction histidine kinase